MNSPDSAIQPEQGRRPLLGITMGDPGGIGPEICAKAMNDPEVVARCRPLVIGDAGIIQNALAFCKINLKVNAINAPADGKYEYGTVDVYDLANMPLAQLAHKTVTAIQGKASYEYVAKAIALAMGGEIDGTVTGPISKAAINLAGYHYAGHTEIYASLTQVKDYAMMLADGGFRVSHVTTHVSLRDACDRIKKERVLKVIQLTDEGLKRMGVDRPKIAVAGLNPHCGEEGLFGTEDQREIAPAVKEAAAMGIMADGPVPADTVFSKMKGGMYDCVVVMYHDQGHIPMKLQGFRYDDKTDVWGNMSGVNVTLGVPFVRTSVDHGTAFDKAGEGRANPQSLLDAIRLGALLAG